MRSSIVVALLIALASACDSAGMEIVVHASADPGTPAPHTVKLYIGVGDGAGGAIAPAPGTRRFTQAMHWDRDPANADDSTAYGTGPARFLFRPGGDIDKFSVVVAVGYDASGAPMSAAVLRDAEMGNAHIKVYAIGLNAITDPAVKPTGYNGLTLWGPSSAQKRDDSCVFVQNTFPAPSAISAFIVTPGDRDCDGLLDQPNPPECNDDVWFGKRTALRAELDCVTTTSPPASGPSCVLGGPACIDQLGLDASCTASRYCLHPALCESSLCGVNNDGAWPCVEDVRVSPRPTMTGYPAITCDVMVEKGSPGSDLKVCSNAGVFDVRKLGLPVGATCSRAQVRNVVQTWADGLVDGTAKYKVSVDDACALKVTGEGSYSSTLAQPELVSGLLAVDLQATMHGLAFPIVFNPILASPGQCAPPMCHVGGAPSDAFTACLASPPPL